MFVVQSIEGREEGREEETNKEQGSTIDDCFASIEIFKFESFFVERATKKESKMSTMAEKQDGQTLNSKFNINT